MGLFDWFTKSSNNDDSLDEANKVFKKRDTTVSTMGELKKRYGEGVEDFNQLTSRFWNFWC